MWKRRKWCKKYGFDINRHDYVNFERCIVIGFETG